MVKCVIVDDEPLARRLLNMHIEKIDGLEIVGECKNIIQLVNVLNKESVDLVFLDIEMPLIKGTEFLRTNRSTAKFILTTAYKDYAFEAFELNVVDYLLKPISFPRLYSAIQKYLAITKQSPLDHQFYYEYITVSINRRNVQIKMNEILYVESMKDYIHIYTNSKCYKTKRTLTSMEEDLSNSFMRVHRSFVINKSRIVSISTKEIILEGNVLIPVGKTYREMVINEEMG